MAVPHIVPILPTGRFIVNEVDDDGNITNHGTIAYSREDAEAERDRLIDVFNAARDKAEADWLEEHQRKREAQARGLLIAVTEVCPN
jgi:hypothetical protein